MKRSVLLLFGGVCLIMAAGCSHLEGYLDIAREKGMSREYQTILTKWTRSRIIYSQFETQAHISATFQSPEFSRAYLDEYSRIYHLREGEGKRREDIQKGMVSDFAEFIFYAYIPEKASNDFDKRGSLWTVFLVNEKGDRIDPVELRRIDPITPLITEFFPYIHPHYGMAYRLRFPSLNYDSGGDFRTLKLVFASVIGEVELKFEGR
jgi:hypothetical protein